MDEKLIWGHIQLLCRVECGREGDASNHGNEGFEGAPQIPLFCSWSACKPPLIVNQDLVTNEGNSFPLETRSWTIPVGPVLKMLVYSCNRLLEKQAPTIF